MDTAVKLLRWHWQRMTQGLDHSSLTFLFLLGLMLVIEVIGIAPRKAQLQVEQAHLGKLTQQLDAMRTRTTTITPSDSLPAISDLTAAVARLHRLAHAQGLALAKVDYQLTREGSGYWRYQMRSESESSYPALRRFLDRAFARTPNLSLDSLDIARTSTDSSRPTVKLALSLYFADSNEQATQP